jgi:hypothetical protein
VTVRVNSQSAILEDSFFLRNYSLDLLEEEMRDSESYCSCSKLEVSHRVAAKTYARQPQPNLIRHQANLAVAVWHRFWLPDDGIRKVELL